MSLKDEFSKFRTPQLFYTDTGGDSGNQLLFTAEAIVCMRAAQVWDIADQISTELAIAKTCQIESGLYGRGPGYMQDQISVDDSIGLGIISWAFAIRVRSYGWKHFWYFKTGQNVAFWAPFLGRFPALWAHLAWCSYEVPNIFLRMAWCYSVAFGGKPGDQDSWILNNLLIKACFKPGILEKMAIMRYKKQLAKEWGTLGKCLTRYFGFEHPIAKYWPEIQ